LKYIIPLIVILSFNDGLACKYTVRDIGFTDLGKTEYDLYLLINNKTSIEMISAFEKLSYAAFLDANVKAETINIITQTNHSAIKYIEKLNITTFPALILVSPDRDALRLPFDYQSDNLNRYLWRLIESAVSSPLRDKINKITKNDYGAVLFIEGKNSEKNRRVLQMVKTVIKDISKVMKLMPKPIENPPKLLTLSQKKLDKERVLLWSLKIDPNFYGAQLVVIFGRGRRMGQVLKGKKITKDNLFNLLAIVGADCECGLDRSIMLGKMIPLRWDKNMQAQISRQLGFDVENPMIKSEMSQILSIAPKQKGKNAQNPLSVYKEGIVKFDTIPSTPTVSSNNFRSSGGKADSKANYPDFFILLYSLIGIVIVALISGLYIFRQNRRNKL